MFETIHPTVRRTMAASLLIATTLGASASAQTAGTPPSPPASPVPAHAATAQPAPIPDVPLIARDGSAATTAKALPAHGHWLLLHVQKGSAASESLLGRIQGDAWSTVPPRLAIVVSGAAAAEVDQLAARFPALASAAWYADEPGALAGALQIQESPLILAVHNRGIQWTLSGVLSGSKRMQTVLTSWVVPPPGGRQTSER